MMKAHLVLTIAMMLCCIGATVDFIVEAAGAAAGTERMKNLTNVQSQTVIFRTAQ